MEWLITIQSDRDPEIKECLLLFADTFADAARNAFFTRNIATSWNIVDVECDGIELRKDLLPISGKYYGRTGRVT